jgi:hypothetical protein
MSYVLVAPETVSAAAAKVGRIGASLAAGNAAAAASTTAVMSAAGDQVSAAIASVFSHHGQGYQALAGQLATFHDDFVHALNSGAGSYAAAEAANVSPLQAAAQSAADTLTSRPIIGNGANATTPGGNGADGGWLFGSGGTGGTGGAGGTGGSGGAP